MVYKIADNIISPLGQTTEDNYRAVKKGQTALAYYDNQWGIPEPFTASVFSDLESEQQSQSRLTRFESLVYSSVKKALDDCPIDVSSGNVVLILSTTKSNVELLGKEGISPAVLHPGESARRICSALDINTKSIVVCNACISGLSAIILAERLLKQHLYDYAIVCGADILNRFVISGFQSFKSMDARECRPYDIERLGMNLGEAAATMILATAPLARTTQWAIAKGTVRNDAFHISTPSKKAEGALRCLEAVMSGEHADELAVINAHGTATMFMDQMESVAIERADLTDIPVNSYKGYYGHTLGAAGVLETILTMHAVDDHTVIGTRGFEERGVSGQIQVSAENQPTGKQGFIKLISGFGGSNAALLATKSLRPDSQKRKVLLVKTHQVSITPDRVTIDGATQTYQASPKDMLTELYRQEVGDYPKFYKMDMLSRLGFIATELLLKSEGKKRFVADEHRAVILFNHSSSLHADTQYLESIKDLDNFFPSPSLFVYTLPNIVTGEIAIRNQYHGETSFYILAEEDESIISQVQQASLCDPATESMISGWLDYEDDTNFKANIYILDTGQ
ncbi:MAG: 3-oxoacyl-ACP synthase [Prevotella sp.]|nr:3-oxoacyl-ACP synthase [Prevotella sp.]